MISASYGWIWLYHQIVLEKVRLLKLAPLTERYKLTILKILYKWEGKLKEKTKELETSALSKLRGLSPQVETFFFFFLIKKRVFRLSTLTDLTMDSFSSWWSSLLVYAPSLNSQYQYLYLIVDDIPKGVINYAGFLGLYILTWISAKSVELELDLKQQKAAAVTVFVEPKCWRQQSNWKEVWAMAICAIGAQGAYFNILYTNRSRQYRPLYNALPSHQIFANSSKSSQYYMFDNQKTTISQLYSP